MVHITGVQGGYADLGYEAQLEVTFRAAANRGVAGARLWHLDAGANETLAIDLPELDRDAEVCARVRVYDAIDTELVRETCARYADLIAATPYAPNEDLDGDEDLGGDRPTEQNGSASEHDADGPGGSVSSCSLGAPHTSRSTSAALLLATLLSTLYRRRRLRG